MWSRLRNWKILCQKIKNLSLNHRIQGMPGGSADKESAGNAGDTGSILGLGGYPGEEIGYPLQYWASLVAQMIKNLPAVQETWVQSLGQEDPLEKRMATHFSILAWSIPWTEGPGGLQSTGSQRAGYDSTAEPQHTAQNISVYCP